MTNGTAVDNRERSCRELSNPEVDIQLIAPDRQPASLHVSAPEGSRASLPGNGVGRLSEPGAPSLKPLLNPLTWGQLTAGLQFSLDKKRGSR